MIVSARGGGTVRRKLVVDIRLMLAGSTQEDPSEGLAARKNASREEAVSVEGWTGDIDFLVESGEISRVPNQRKHLAFLRVVVTIGARIDAREVRGKVKIDPER